MRCGKCEHIWHEEPVRDSLDDLSSNDFIAEGGVAADMMDQPQDIPAGVQPLSDFPAYQTAKQPETSAFRAALIDYLPQITGVVMGFAIFAVIAMVLVGARNSIMSAMPFTQPVFVALGFVEPPSDKTLVFDSVTAKIVKDELIVSGSLINLSSEMIKLPPLAVEILDSGGEIMDTYPAKPDQDTLKGEESMTLNFSYHGIPDQAQQVRLKFQTQQVAEDKEEPAEPTTDAEGAGNTPSHSEGDSDHSTAHE